VNFFRKIILAVLANAGALWGADYFLAEKFAIVGGIFGFIFAGTVLGILNTFVKPFLKIFALPFVIVTMGLFLIFVNSVLLWILKWIFENPLAETAVRIEISGGFLSLIFSAAILSICNSLLHWVVRND
jgi:putative membrane protein